MCFEWEIRYSYKTARDCVIYATTGTTMREQVVNEEYVNAMSAVKELERGPLFYAQRVRNNATIGWKSFSSRGGLEQNRIVSRW